MPKNIKLLITALWYVPSLAQGGDYANCLLDKLPGTQNDAVAFAISQVCLEEYPGGYLSTGKGAGRGWLAAYSSGAKCTIKKAENTHSHRAALMIGAACRHLFDEPRPSTSDTPGDTRPWEQAQQFVEHNNVATPPSASTPQDTSPQSLVDQHYNAIYAAHPDADEIANSREFQLWITKNNQEKVLKEGTTQEIIRLFQNYKSYRPTPKASKHYQINPPKSDPCVYKRVMTDEDYKDCNIQPPR